MNKPKDLKGWIILAICLATLAYSIISNYAIRGNDFKHLNEKVDALLVRVERIENLFITKGE